MEIDAVRTGRDELVARYGEWTAHNIRLAGDLSTRGAHPDDRWRLRRVVQLVADLVERPISELRVLDLGSLEGQYAIEFGQQGAEAVGIEGREANVERARFARDALGLEHVELRHEDVRNLNPETHGRFDVVLCLGILYHLDARDVFPFLDRLAAVCTRLLIVDTHVALSGRSSYVHRGREHRGLSFVEHSGRASAEQRERSAWASLDNPRSFWPTRPSLMNALARAGFTSVLQCEVPYMPTTSDRLTLVALRGEPVQLRSLPPGASAEPPEVPERGPRRRVRNQSRLFMLAKRTVLRLRAERERVARR